MKKFPRFLCLVFALMFAAGVLTGCSPIPQDGVQESDAAPDGGGLLPGRGARYADMVYTRPDFEQFSAAVQEAYALLEAENADFFAAYEAAKRRYRYACTQYSLAETAYSRNITDEYYAAELSVLSDEINAAQVELLELSAAALDSAFGAEAEMRWGRDRVEKLCAERKLVGDEIADDLAREQSLVMEYQRIATGFSAQIGGKTYALADIYADGTLSGDEFEQMLGAYYAALAGEVGPIYRELVTIRTRIATAMGYDNYSDYAYACYGRDFSPADAARLHDMVKRYAVPLYRRMNRDEAFLCSEGYAGYAYAEYTAEEAMDALAAAAEEFSPKLAEACSFIRGKELYCLTGGADSLEGGFTAYFEAYRCPFLYVHWDGGSYSVGTLIHEMGHVCSYYYLQEDLFGAVDSLELAETDSQGLELLLFPCYEIFYGESADAARREKLSDMMYALISGCMEDEFQQRVYGDPGMTLEEMNALYGRLLEEYGFSDLYYMPEQYWTAIPHTFQSPMYYISYAVSALPALELWALSVQNETKANELYWTLVERSPMAAFRAELDTLGLSDPFYSDIVQRVCAAAEQFVWGRDTALAA